MGVLETAYTIASQSTARAPLRPYTFLVHVADPAGDSGVPLASKVFTLQTRRLTLPGLTLGENIVDWINARYKLAGKVTVNDMTIGIELDENLEALKVLHAWFDTICKMSDATFVMEPPSVYKKDITVDVLNTLNDVIAIYTFHKCWPMAVPDIPFDYTTDAPLVIDVTMKVDWFTIDWRI